jgi:preprotein translocase subunit YajC
MDFFISAAHAQAAAQQQSIWPSLAMLGVFFAIFYFLLIRPQQKRMAEHKSLVAGLKKGDEVLTNGGIAGRVEDVGESFLVVEIAAGTTVKLQKQAVTAVLPKGTLKST